MTEAFHNEPAPVLRESAVRTYAEEIDPVQVAQLRQTAEKMNIDLPATLSGVQGGGILGPKDGITEKMRRETADNPRAKAIIAGKTHGSTEPNLFIHFPTNKENPHFGANFYSFQSHVGEYLRHHWDTETNGLNPLQGVVGSMRLEDGRYVTAARFRKGYEPLGVPGPNGVHELDTSKIKPGELRYVVRVLDAMHVPSRDFAEWLNGSKIRIPPESWMNRDNPQLALRGQEWWIAPSGIDDRLHELSRHALIHQDMFRAIDADFRPAKPIESFIRNNIGILPHVNGTIDRPDISPTIVVAHGALHPKNVHIKRTPEGVNVTVSGGDRAHGMGVAAESVDWLVTAVSGSPAHQEAIISEFLKLHPKDSDRRALAMQVLYRSLLEATWFDEHGKMREASNAIRMSYDILNGRGVWKGVNTPVQPA